MGDSLIMKNVSRKSYSLDYTKLPVAINPIKWCKILNKILCKWWNKLSVLPVT